MKKHVLSALFSALSLLHWGQFFAPETIVLSSPTTGRGVSFDVDGDGDLDVVQTDLFGPGFIRVYYRNGSDFDEVRYLQILGTSSSFQLIKGYADIDHDGDLDVFNGYGWAENESGQFNTSHYFLTAQHYGENAAAEDLNGDGFVDVVLSNSRHGSTHSGYHLAVLLNDGTGQFTEVSSYTENPINVQLGDVNHDGHSDMYYYDSVADNWFIYPGNGDGTFDAMAVFMSNIAFDSRFVDLNGDGVLDFSVMSNDLPVYTGDLQLFYGVENGGYTPGPIIHIPTWELLWGSNSSWQALDYEGDGDLDIMMRQYNQILWFDNQNGVYAFQGKVGLLTGLNPSMFWTHLNGDNRYDLIETSASLFGYTQNENAILIPASVACEGGCVAGSKFYMVDIDLDDDPEMLSVNNDGTVVINKVNQFGYVSSHVIANSLSGSYLKFLDYDRDGLKDLITKVNQDIYVYRQIAPYQFDVPELVLADIPGTCFDMTEMDVDLDGSLDIVVATNNVVNEVYWLKHQNEMQYESQGLLGQIGPIGLSDAYAKVFHQGDFNGDGIIDFTAITSKTCTHFIRLANGDFDIQQVYIAPNDNDVITSSDRMVSDINLDGRDDVIFMQRTMEAAPKKFYSIRFNGAAYQAVLAHQFSLDEIYTASPTPVWIIADIDADGDDDLIYSIDDQLKRCMNNITGFSSAQFLNITAQSSIYTIAIDDIDHDVMPDLLIGGPYGSLGGFVQSSINNLDSPYQINISAFIDLNEDGVKNGFDESLINQQIALSGNWGYAFTDEEGLYTFYGLAEEYTLTMNMDEDLWIPVTPFIQTVTLSEANPTANLIFAIAPNNTVYDVQGQIITMADVCGSDYGHWISVYNAGNTNASGTVTYTLDEGFTYTWGSPEPASVVGNTITWNYSDLQFNESITYTITAASPGVESIGTTVSHTLEVTALDENDNVMATSFDDNTYIIECAYDPNDIRENLGWSNPGYIKDDGLLEYTIRFQNLGNAPAVDVRIENILSGLHQHGTVVPVASSHDYVVSQDANGHLNFFYENINLPAAEDDELGSHGFITFRIRPIEGLAPNTEILHHANIYFDLNPPIVTNEAVSTILDCESLQITMPSEVCAEEEVSAQADRTEFLNYTWYDGEVELADGISTVFDLNGAGSKTIILEVSNPVCSIIAEQTIEILDAPEILSLSEDVELCGEEVMLEVSGNGDAEWFLEGFSIANSNAILVNQTGGYIVRVSNECGFEEAVVHVNEGVAPEILSVSEDMMMCDESVTLAANGVGEISWWLGNDLIDTTHEISTDQTGVYRVEVSTSCGTISQLVHVLYGEYPSFIQIEELVQFCDEVGVITASGSNEIVWFMGEIELGTGYEIDIDEPGDYRAVMSNACGVVEQTVHVELGEFPEFTMLPDDQVVCDESIELSAAGTGTIRWYLDELNVGEGASVMLSDAGNYTIEISNACGVATHDVLLTVDNLPSFTEINESFSFCDELGVISASGTEDIVWFAGDTELSVGNDLNITEVGDYRAVMTNVCGVVEQTVHVELVDSPEFFVLPQDQIICEEPVELNASGNGMIYWYLDELLVGEGNSIVAANAGNYLLVIESACGVATDNVLLDQRSLPEFIEIDEVVVFCDEVGVISASGTENIVWVEGETEIGVGNELDIEEPGDYRAVMSNVCGVVEQMVHVEVAESPEFSSTFDDVMTCGEPITLIAEGNGEVNWYFENVEFIGSGNEVTVTQAGTYVVFLETACAIINEELVVVEGVQPIFSSYTTEASICNGVAELAAEGNGDLIWFFGDDFIGAGNSILAQNSGIYSVVLSTECGVQIADVSVQEAEYPVFESVTQDIETCEAFVELEAYGSNDEDQVTWYIDGEMVSEGSLFTMTSTNAIEVVIDNGCASTSQEISIVLNSDPMVELLWDPENEVVVATAGFASYQWSDNGVVIPNNNSNTYSPQGTEVSVIVTDENLCSADASITISAISHEKNSGFVCYPNPARDIIWIEVPNHSIDQRIMVIDAFGKLVYSQRVVTGGMNQLDISQLSSGIYSFVFDNLVQKVVVQ